jgi:iron complex transport system permease protein
LLVLVTASLAASAAVAVAGQIAFVGLVVPHLVRLAGFRSCRTLLPLSLVGGAIFLLGADVAQRYLLERELFKPGVLMSLVGGPFFLFLLVRSRSQVRTW